MFRHEEPSEREGRLSRLPSLFSHEFDEAATAQVGLVNPVLIFNELDEILRKLISHRNDHAAAHGQLGHQGRRYFRGPGRYDDRVKRRGLFEAVIPVALVQINLLITLFAQNLASAIGQRLDDLDRVDVIGQVCQDGRLVAGSGADLQYFRFRRQS